MKIRIKFEKYGVMKFIGHLDVMRFFQKALRRAEIDMKYSEGFNPHQVMSFAAPLGVGIESMGEYMDIEVHSITSTEAVKDALNQVMVEGISILSVRVLPEGAKNAMASVAAARYRVAYHQVTSAESSEEGNVTAETIHTEFPVPDLEKKLAAFYAQEKIPVIKKTKKGETELDLKPGIYELYVETAQNPFSEEKETSSVISMLVDASSSGNIKPSLVLEAFWKYCQAELQPYACRITRVDVYTNLAGDGEEMRLVPLDAAGR